MLGLSFSLVHFLKKRAKRIERKQNEPVPNDNCLLIDLEYFLNVRNPNVSSCINRIRHGLADDTKIRGIVKDVRCTWLQGIPSSNRGQATNTSLHVQCHRTFSGYEQIHWKVKDEQYPFPGSTMNFSVGARPCKLRFEVCNRGKRKTWFFVKEEDDALYKDPNPFSRSPSSSYSLLATKVARRRTWIFCKTRKIMS